MHYSDSTVSALTLKQISKIGSSKRSAQVSSLCSLPELYRYYAEVLKKYNSTSWLLFIFVFINHPSSGLMTLVEQRRSQGVQERTRQETREQEGRR